MTIQGRKPILRRKRPPEEAEMDITPMIDCTFLLLIFFLVSSRMDADISVELPPAKHGTTVVVKETVVITVAKGPGDHAQVFKGDNTDPKNLVPGANVVEQEDALVQYIEQQMQSVPPKRYLLIKGEHDVRHGDVARVGKAAARTDIDQLYEGVLESN